jgi:hypothetical protein
VSAADSTEDPTMATRKVTLTAEDRETVRRHLSAIKYLRDKYGDAGLGLREAVDEVVAIAPPSMRERIRAGLGPRKR